MSWSPQKNTARICRIGLLTTGFTTHSSHAITSFFSLFALANLAREFLYLLMEAYSLPPYLLYVTCIYLGRLRIFIYSLHIFSRMSYCSMYADSCKWSKHFFAIFPIPQSAEDDTLKADVPFFQSYFYFAWPIVVSFMSVSHLTFFYMNICQTKPNQFGRLEIQQVGHYSNPFLSIAHKQS